MVSRSIFYKSKNKEEGLLINAEIVYPIDEQNIIPMSEIGGGLYKATISFNNNTTYVVKIEDSYKFYEIGDIIQNSHAFIKIKNISFSNIFVFNIIEGKESGVYLKPNDEALISILAYKLQKDDSIFKDYIEVIG